MDLDSPDATPPILPFLERVTDGASKPRMFNKGNKLVVKQMVRAF